MTREGYCPQGHRFPLSEDAAADALNCPVCGVAIEPTAATPPPTGGLWQMMSRGESSSEENQPTTADVDADETTEAKTGPKGLWSMMGQSTSAAPAEVEKDAPSADRADDSQPAPRGLWSVMKSDEGDATKQFSTLPPLPDAADPPVELDDLPAKLSPVEIDDFMPAPLEEDDDAKDDPTDDDRENSATPEPLARSPLSRGARNSLLLGLVAIAMSLLPLLPLFWVQIPNTILGLLRMPAPVMGLFALGIGYLSLGEIRRSRGKLTGPSTAIVGMCAGTIGMLLGPLLLAEFGEQLQREISRRATKANLETVGGALNSYYTEYDKFPPGSSHTLDADGGDIALHSWQTLLLPYLGEDAVEIHGAIDLNEPYNADINRPAMRRDVPFFHAAGADSSKAGNGFGITHFAALGGQRDIDGVGRVNIGIFSRNSTVTREDVTDGLAHTLVAGEIAYSFPPWGEPANYRTIGKGLNKDRDGFGNRDRTGAMFLRADGTVKFFSNAIDPKVLRKLSTRDGQEKVADDY